MSVTTPTSQRERSIRLAASDPKQAVAIASVIDDPWFRCQSLAYAGRYWPGDDYKSLLTEAVKAADSQDNWYKRVSVSAWPIRAYLERDCSTPAKRLLEQYANEASNIDNRGGRSEALMMLFQAAKPFDRGIWEPILWSLVRATEPAIAWRQVRNIRNALAMVSADVPSLVHEATKRLADEKIVTQIKRDFAMGKTAEPRPFFWPH
ncbi:hypothetical protein [Sphingomonas phyllosphaerae]|uniref:hypothetical protein n=1 Tax=Sphingomonas phyllosphaerae TaxID=257003 RepID=UPI0012DCE247|nr:hypothetical protein [Sphingomonas phyllosphaerae]